jgi:hypothetical protein
MESMFTTSLHLSDFVQTQNEAKILTIAVLFNCTHMVWHLICLTCSSSNYVYDVVFMIIL